MYSGVATSRPERDESRRVFRNNADHSERGRNDILSRYETRAPPLIAYIFILTFPPRRRLRASSFRAIWKGTPARPPRATNFVADYLQPTS